ncbi:MAG: hypothetical protein L0271_17335 [Gemmatimonadetes bacterium]|nr:hypothetical protein [Gemmatimonadota bacterium]
MTSRRRPFTFGFFPVGSFGLGCDRKAPQCLSEQDKVDIINFMQLLSFERLASAAPEARPEQSHRLAVGPRWTELKIQARGESWQ